MKKKQYIPKGWTLKRIQDLAAHYDHQTEEEEYQEIERALKSKELSWVAVPVELVDEVTKLIAKRQSA